MDSKPLTPCCCCGKDNNHEFYLEPPDLEALDSICGLCIFEALAPWEFLEKIRQWMDLPT